MALNSGRSGRYRIGGFGASTGNKQTLSVGNDRWRFCDQNLGHAALDAAMTGGASETDAREVVKGAVQKILEQGGTRRKAQA